MCKAGRASPLCHGQWLLGCMKDAQPIPVAVGDHRDMMFILFFSSTIQLLVFLQRPGRWRPCHHRALEVSLAGKLFSGSPRAHWSLKPERGVWGHLLVTFFNRQVHAAAVGEVAHLFWSFSRYTILYTDIHVLYFCIFPDFCQVHR